VLQLRNEFEIHGMECAAGYTGFTSALARSVLVGEVADGGDDVADGPHRATCVAASHRRWRHEGTYPVDSLRGV